MPKLKVLIIGFSLLLPLNAYAQSCASPQEKLALNIRAMQSHLMVAALSCGQKNEYNSFISTSKPFLNKHSKHLTSYFNRSKGNTAKKINNFVTGLANKSSQVSLNMDEWQYCNNAKQIFDSITKSRNPEVMIIKAAADDNFSNLHGIYDCQTIAMQDMTR